MKLEHQFTTIEQSKKLVELGIDANLAKFWHVELDRMKDVSFDEVEYEKAQYIVAKTDAIYDISTHIAPAFSMSEVMKMLYYCTNYINCADSIIEHTNELILRIETITQHTNIINSINKALQD